VVVAVAIAADAAATVADAADADTPGFCQSNSLNKKARNGLTPVPGFLFSGLGII
jgi:hypothetical protein